MESTIIGTLLSPLLSMASSEWTSRNEFKTLRGLALERLCRELRWNVECIQASKADRTAVTLSLLRTKAFDSLVQADAPLDVLLKEDVRHEWLRERSFQSHNIHHAIRACSTVSDLIDESYHRIWMIKHLRQEAGLIDYFIEMRDLTLITLAHTQFYRRHGRPTKVSFLSVLDDLMSRICGGGASQE